MNVATDLMTEPWAWVGVVALTGLGVVLALKVQAGAPQVLPPAVPSVAQEEGPSEGSAVVPTPPVSHGGVHNSVSGTVHGPVIQAGSIGAYHNRSVNQSAVASENSTIHQAGRDIRSDDSGA